MTFPEGQRLFYKKNTLSNVIVQLRFPPILGIESSIPSPFQDVIINVCQEYERKQIVQHQFNIGGHLNPATLQIQPPAISQVHVFKDSSKGIAIELGSNSLTVAFSKYEKWEKAKEVLLLAISALEKNYAVSYYTRVGLRYIDRFILSELGFRKGKDWKKLLNPVFLGLVASGIQTLGFQNVSEVSLEQHNAKATITTASLKNKGESTIGGIVLDYDCYIDGNSTREDLQGKLEYLHVQSRDIFEYAIKQQLRNSMGVETDYDKSDNHK